MRAAARTMAALGGANALLAAERCGLLGALDARWRTARDLAAALGLDAELVELTLSMLVLDGWAERSERGFRGPPWLLADEAEAHGGLEATARVFDGLDAALRGHAPATPGPSPAYSAAAVARLGDLFESCAAGLLGRLDEQDLGAGLIVDVGAGAAVWSLAYAVSMPQVRLTLVDGPDPLAAARCQAERLGVSDRVEFLCGDAFDVALPWASRVIAANLLHLFPREQARALVHRLAERVLPGGKLILIGQDRRASKVAAAHAIHLRLRRPDARSHEPETVSEWIVEAGLRAPRVLTVCNELPGLVAVVGERRRRG
jgi:hypothetical protein